MGKCKGIKCNNIAIEGDKYCKGCYEKCLYSLNVAMRTAEGTVLSHLLKEIDRVEEKVKGE